MLLSCINSCRDLALLALNSASEFVYSAIATVEIRLRSSALSLSHSCLLTPVDRTVPGSWNPG